MSFAFYNRIIYPLKQLLPFRYYSNYTDANDYVHTTAWRMWFGRIFDMHDWFVDEEGVMHADGD